MAEIRTPLIVVLALSAAAAGPMGSGARAQDGPNLAEADPPAQDDTARARALFEEGVAHVDAGRWSEAAVKFRAALELRDAPAVRFNLASALVALEEYPEAETLARGILADATLDASLRDRTEELLVQIGQAAGQLTVDIRGATEGVTVRIDGEAVEPSSVVHQYSLNPRGYTVVIERDGQEIQRRAVTVEAGQNAEVAITVAPSASETAAASEGSSSNGGGDGRRDDLVTDWRFWAVVGVAVALTIVLAVVASQ